MSKRAAPTNFDAGTFLEDLAAGVFTNKVTAAIKSAATGAVDFDKKGEVTIKLTFERIEESRSVVVKHEVAYKQPTANGHVGEQDATSTPMHVNADGSVTPYPMADEDMGDLFKANAGIAGEESTHDR